MKILIVEDELPLANVLKQALEREGHEIQVAHDGEAAGGLVTGDTIELLLLDLTLPKLDGFEVLKRATASGSSEKKILILSGRSRVEDRVRALDEGADDFLVKPFSLLELSARVRALQRRNTTKEVTKLQVSDLVIDRLRGVAQRGGRQIELTSREFALLEMLAAHQGKPVSRMRILENVWNANSDRPSNVVDVYINYGIRVTEIPQHNEEPCRGGVSA